MTTSWTFTSTPPSLYSSRCWGCFWWLGTAVWSSQWAHRAPPESQTPSSGTKCTTRRSLAPTWRATAIPTPGTWTTSWRSSRPRGSQRRSAYPEIEPASHTVPTETELKLETDPSQWEISRGWAVGDFSQVLRHTMPNGTNNWSPAEWYSIRDKMRRFSWNNLCKSKRETTFDWKQRCRWENNNERSIRLNS